VAEVRQHALLPLSLIDRIIEILGCWDISKYDVVIQLEHYDILRTLKIKQQKRELRDDYAKMIHANNQDDKFEARIQYLQHKRTLAELIDPPF
jgi:hypothetical protein